MKQYKYTGDDPNLIGHTGLGRVTPSGAFRVQLDDLDHPMGFGWHRQRAELWEPVDRDAEAIADPADLIEIRTSKGGFVGHWCSKGKTACGYAPSSPNGHLIRNRAGWRSSQTMTWFDALNGEIRLCPKCEKKLIDSIGCDEPERPTCSGCGEEIDPETCHCGEAITEHGWHGNHSPVPMGCNCHRSD